MKIVVFHLPWPMGNYKLNEVLAAKLQADGHEVYLLQQLNGHPYDEDYYQQIKSIEPDVLFYEMLDQGTFDVVEKKYYRGGIIAPGVKISLDTLSDKASLISQIDLKKIRNIVGNNTISAVRSGFFWGYIGLIDNIINLIKKETRKSFKLVITGGYSDLFRKSLKTRVIQNKDITIKGLIKIAKLIR